MGSSCCDIKFEQINQKIRKVLWLALILNFAMFIVEIAMSYFADSVALKADALDFLGDSFNYGISLYVLNAAIKKRAQASFIKASCMGVLGIWVILEAVKNTFSGVLPNAQAMGAIGFIALLVNAFVAWTLYKFRDTDSNMQSVWLCSRNDVIGNLAVILAASGVFYSGTVWPDLIVAFIMGSLGITSSIVVFKKAKIEIKAE